MYTCSWDSCNRVKWATQEGSWGLTTYHTRPPTMHRSRGPRGVSTYCMITRGDSLYGGGDGSSSSYGGRGVDGRDEYGGGGDLGRSENVDRVVGLLSVSILREFDDAYLEGF